MSQVVNLVIDQGANAEFDINVIDELSNSAANLSNYSITGALQKHFESANSHAFECTGYANGVLVIAMDAVDTANIQPGKYLYDVKMSHDSTNNVIRVQEGIITVKGHIT